MRAELEAQLDRYENFLKSDPDNIKLILNVASLYHKLGRFSEAFSIVDKGLSISPSNSELLFTQATISMASNDPSRAITILQELLDNQVDNPALHYNLAYSHALAGQMHDAHEALKEKLSSTAQSIPETLILNARIEHYLGDLDSAIHSVMHFVEQHSSHPKIEEAEGVLSLLLLDTEQMEQAEHYAEQALNKNQNNVEALITVGSASLAALDTEKAEKYYKTVLEKQPDSGRGWLGMGLIELYRKNFSQAEDALKNCVKSMPSHLGSWNTLTWSQIIADKTDDAEKTIKQALEIDRNFGESHGTLAIIQIMKGELDEANKSVKRALGLDKNSFSANYAKAILQSSVGDTESAKHTIKTLLSNPIDKQGRTIESALKGLSVKNQNSRN